MGLVAAAEGVGLVVLVAAESADFAVGSLGWLVAESSGLTAAAVHLTVYHENYYDYPSKS